MADMMRWGILGTGKIGQRMGQTLGNIPDATLAAIGSRSQKSADAFGAQFDVPHRYASYEGVVNDPDVDVIYVATPNNLHHRDVMMCLEAGKHVLCEKSFTINAAEAKSLIDTARTKNLFLMEAMWTRFFPLHVWLRKAIADGIIGRLKYMNVAFGWRPEPDPTNRFFNRDLGGGTLLDLGVYGFAFVWSLLGKPDHVTSQAVFSESGVDVQSAHVLTYDTGQMAVVSVSLTTHNVRSATVSGEKGKVDFPAYWYKPQQARLEIEGEEPRVVELPYDGTGQEFEVREVIDCIRAGKTESDIMPLDETLAIMQLTDSIRAEWGLTFPADNE